MMRNDKFTESSGGSEPPPYDDQASIVEMVRVVSSRTSSRTRTVSSAVNMVTLYSVAILRISKPSAALAPGSRVLIT